MSKVTKLSGSYPTKPSIILTELKLKILLVINNFLYTVSIISTAIILFECHLSLLRLVNLV
ncbi:hypothetical protein J2Z60_000580 [Lactobacillus colini]|uniref:Uncharacterized protein n=1 Tax=Lactobacillus colini TaxID=1819254 RepID=A0ABS4MCN2_9LACO|nr:hypothetical protein [Lactobacillus colini]